MSQSRYEIFLQPVFLSHVTKTRIWKMMYKKRSGRRCQSRQFPKSLLPDTLLMLWNHLSRPFSAKFVVFFKKYRVTLKLHKRFRSQPITLRGIYFALNSGTGISTSLKEKKLEDSGISETEFCIFLCSRSLLNIWRFFSWFDEFHLLFFVVIIRDFRANKT